MKIVFNAPVTLLFLAVGLAVLVINLETGDALIPWVSCSASDSYLVGFVAYPFGHADLWHYLSNAFVLLLVGPIAEERYGSGPLVIMMLITTFLIAIIHLLVSPDVAVLGSSGIVFMCVILSAHVQIAHARHTGVIRVPVTLLLVVALYLGLEFFMIGSPDNISHMAHVTGGVCGFILGFAYPVLY